MVVKKSEVLEDTYSITFQGSDLRKIAGFLANVLQWSGIPSNSEVSAVKEFLRVVEEQVCWRS